MRVCKCLSVSPSNDIITCKLHQLCISGFKTNVARTYERMNEKKPLL